MTIRFPPNYLTNDFMLGTGVWALSYIEYRVAWDARKDIIEHDYDIGLYDSVRFYNIVRSLENEKKREGRGEERKKEIRR